jgi:hypothetical protein
MEIMNRYVVLTASVILFVLLACGNGATIANGTVAAGSAIDSEEGDGATIENGTVAAGSANDSKEGNTTDSHKNLVSIITAVFENAKSVNFINFLPNPIQSLISFVKEIFYILKKLGPTIPKLLFHPISLITTIFPYFVSLVLIALTFIPTMVLPCKIIAFFLSILGLFNAYWAPFDKTYLSGL